MRPPPEILTAARILLKLTQAGVADDYGLGTRTVFGAENGKANIISVEQLVRYYEEEGITFIEPKDGQGWGLLSRHTIESYDVAKQRKLDEGKKGPE